MFPSLPGDFFNAIAISGETASVSIPGLVTPLTLTSPRCGVIALVIPNTGVVTTSLAPRVDGQAGPQVDSQAARPDAAKELLVELQTATSGYRVARLAGTWTFDDLGWLVPGLRLLQELRPIIPTDSIALRGFDVNLYTGAPGLSSISVDVADKTEPDKALWSAAGGKVELTDVVVALDLAYSADNTLSLPGTGSVQGNFRLGPITLSAQIPYPPAGIWSVTAYPDVSLPGLDDLASLLGITSLRDLLPAGLADIGSFELTYLRLAVDISSFSLVEFTVGLESTRQWKLIQGVVELESLQISLTIGRTSVTGAVVGTMQLPGGEGIVVSFGCSTPQSHWQLEAVSPAVALPSIGQLAKLAQGEDLSSMIEAGGLDTLSFVMTNLNFGMDLSTATLTHLGLTLQLAADAHDPLTPTLDWDLIPGKLTLTQFSFGFQIDWGDTVKKTAFGTFVLNGLEFDVRFARHSTTGASTDGLIAEYFARGDTRPVHIKDLINSISKSVAAGLPDGLEINLADAVLAYLNTDGTKKFLFAMDIAAEFPISDLPLVGTALPADAKVGVKNLKMVVTSEAMSAADVEFINTMSPKAVLPLPAAGAAGDAIPAGLSIAAELELGPLSILLTSPQASAPASPAGPQLARRAAGALVDAPAAAPASDQVTWVQVQKTFGPVHIEKVGFSYQEGRLSVVANLALSVGGLEIDLLGIGISSPLRPPAVEFTIQGLAVSFAEGPISIVGGMLGPLQPPDFTGVLSVQAPELSLSAFASYAEDEDHHPSFFLYGVLDSPVGGPPAFFVTGIAAGMGFNRKLLIPDVSGVATFPLVLWAQGKGTPSMDASALAPLVQSGVVAPSVGDYWFAAGVEFTSFEIIKSSALLTVSLGTDVEIALLGLSTLTLPPDDPEPVAKVQLALEASFSASRGLLAIAGQLTRDSYVFSPKGRLTGGFAFYVWFTGEHAGETVLTLGGYNPRFAVPGYYPVVPRIGLNWQVVPALNITGELYFAVTPNIVMAGGKLSAVWNSGTVSAWFTYWADFLMTFSPFHYYVDGGIDLGASFTIDLLFCSVSITIHVGVAIELWGPPFAGRATVDLSIISFTISFNDEHPADAATTIEWPDFVRQLLPAQPPSRQGRARGGRPVALAGPPPSQPAVVQITVTSGLVRTLDPAPDHPVYLVTAETFQCAVLTLIPSKDVIFTTKGEVRLECAPAAEQPKDPHGNPIVPATDFGVGPVGIPADLFTPQLTLTVSSPASSVLHAYRRLTNAPKALWEDKKRFEHGVPLVDPASGLTRATIPDTLTGFTLIPHLDSADILVAVPLESLLSTLTAPEQPFAWSPGVPPASDSFTDETVADTIAAPGVTDVRDLLLDALAGQGVTVSTAVDVSGLASTATAGYQVSPRLRLLGEQPAAT